MKAIEFFCNGRRLFTAGLENGVVTARLIVRNQTDPVWFDVDGRDASTGGHERWAHIPVQLGDEFVVKLVEIDGADAAPTSPNENREMAEQ